MTGKQLYLVNPLYVLLILFAIPQAAENSISDQEAFCGSSERHAAYLQNHPEAADQWNDAEKAWQQHIPLSGKMTYTLPVVFHVIHNNGPENLAEPIVLAGLDHLNDAFANVNYYDQGTGVDTEIEFCLAQQDPDGNFTTGINYVQSPLTNMNMDTEDLAVKDLIRWDPTSYINIWIVGEICSINGCSVAGYAYFPSSHGSDVDGIVMEATYLGSSEANSGVLVHEMGHYLGLYHTFEGGCSNDDCTANGDRVCDTPPDQSTAWVPCGTPVNTCDTDTDSGFVTDQDDLINNYLDYSDFNCYNAFTQGQSDRMEFFITTTRSSLLDSEACSDPCLSPLTATFDASGTDINVGETVTFTNTGTGGTMYNWTVDGTSFATTEDASFTFTAEGTYTIELTVTNADPNCEESFSIDIEVSCQVVADFTAGSTDVQPGTVVFFTNYSQNATAYEWYLDGALEATTTGFDYQFDLLGTYDVQLVATNGICSDTSALQVITVSTTGSAQTGLPVWPMTVFGGPGVQVLDWTQDPFSVETVTNSGEDASGSTGAGFDGCGGLVFYAAHTGSSQPDNLFIFAPDGTELLTNNTPNGPGLDAVRSGQEIQVIRVPGIANEWYIIYNAWSSDTGAPLNNAAYNANNLAYSRIRLTGDVLEVLEKDILITDGNGTAQTYNDGMAVSRTAFGDPDAHFLYATRRAENSTVLSLDRFLIDQNGITWDANTGTVPSSYWDLTHAGSHIELSPTEDRIAVCNRNQFGWFEDYYIFDANTFDNVNVEVIMGSDLVLVADGTANDQSDVLPYTAPVGTVAADNSLPLAFLANFGRKLANLEFSPNGRFLYIVNGGYVSGGFSNITYLAQIDLEADPLEVRLQVQWPPNGIYNAGNGMGCATQNPGCLDDWHGINSIESGYDGRLYFGKRGLASLFVIPDPNNVMPQNLIPSDVDLSTPDAPNIALNAPAGNLPDQIDGFNYFLSRYTQVELPVNGVDCANDCRAPYELEVLLNGTVLNTYTIDLCPDTIQLCVDTTQAYALHDPLLGITYDSAVVGGEVQFPDQESVFDFSDLTGCEEICNNGIDDDNDGLIDCDDPDLQNDCCCQIPTDVLDLGPDQAVCENGVFTFNAGSGYAEYIWQDYSSDSLFTAIWPGTYWVEVTDSCGNSFSDTVTISVIPFTDLDLGPDLTYCTGDGPLQLQAAGFDSYIWTPDTYLSCTDCPEPELSPTADITYIVVGQTDEGCVSVDTLMISVGDPNFTQLDTAACTGSSVVFDGQEILPGESATFNYQTTAGCDSTIVVNVAIDGEADLVTIDTATCVGTSITYNGIPIDAGETFEFTYQNQAGCDSVIVVNVAELATYTTEETVFFCPGDTITVNGVPVFTELTLATTYTAANGCDSTHTAFVFAFDQAEIELTGDGSCVGAADGFLTADPVGGQPPFVYNWSHAGISGPMQTDLVPGPYAVTVTDSNGCESTANAVVQEFPLPDYSLNLTDPGCAGVADGTLEVVSAEPGLSYSLDGQTYQNDPVFTNLAAGSYTLYIEDSYGCIYEQTASLFAPPTVQVALPPDTTIQLGTSLGITPVLVNGDSLTYQWLPVVGLDCQDCPSVVATPSETTEYVVIVTDSDGCSAEARILVAVDALRLVYIPNVFSPNFDGVNDLFHPFAGPGVEEIIQFKVFSRWGELLYSDGGYAPQEQQRGWDGTFRGELMGTGVYVYFIEMRFSDGEEAIYEGSIQLLR